MAVVTELKYQKNKSRANVYLDGFFVCGLETSTIVKNGIKVGVEITASRLEELQAESEVERAQEKALSLLERQKYTKKQISTKLKTKGYLPATIEKVIEKLEEYGYVSDEDYAGSFIRSTGNKSVKELKFSLISKGVKQEIVERAIEEAEVDEVETIERLAEKFMRYKENTKENRTKLLSYLYRKGFEYSAIQSAIGKFNIDDDYE